MMTSYTAVHPVSEISHIGLYKCIVFLPCQIDFVAVCHGDAVLVIGGDIGHIDQISSVAAVKVCTELLL